MLRPKVIDADGHIYENHEEIEKYFEGKHRGMRRARLRFVPISRRLAARSRRVAAGAQSHRRRNGLLTSTRSSAKKMRKSS